MLELTEWFDQARFPPRPWLVVGKGPTFDRRSQFDLSEFNVVGLNHVIDQIDVDVAHIVDVNVVADCADRLVDGCRWLLMPRYPHVHSTSGTRRLEDWFDELPVLRSLDEQGRLVWYNLVTDPPVPGSPVIAGGEFSSQLALAILGRMGVRIVRSLGVDGGRSYAETFESLEDATLLENGAPTFDMQFERLREIADEYGVDYQSLVAPLRIFVGCEESQVVAYRVLEYSIRKASSVPVEVVPMMNLDHPMPRDARNRPRTGFSFARFMIPELCGGRGRALYLDADMLVFGDVAELHDMPFDGRAVLCSGSTSTDAWDGFESHNFGASAAVMLIDCERASWDIAGIVAALDRGEYTYEQLMGDLCIVAPGDIAAEISEEWNHLEVFEPGRTKLLHFTVVPTQPWKSDANELGDVWMACYREAVEAGAVPPEEVEQLVAAGDVKPALRAALRRAPSRRTVLTRSSLDILSAQREIARLEAQVSAMKRSVSWRIGTTVVHAARVPTGFLKRLRTAARR